MCLLLFIFGHQFDCILRVFKWNWTMVCILFAFLVFSHSDHVCCWIVISFYKTLDTLSIIHVKFGFNGIRFRRSILLDKGQTLSENSHLRVKKKYTTSSIQFQQRDLFAVYSFCLSKKTKMKIIGKTLYLKKKGLW